MSSWSSFEKDKIATDAWRSYLNEWRGMLPAVAGVTGSPQIPRIKAPKEEDEEEEEEETPPDEEGADEAAFIPVPSPFGPATGEEDPTASDPESPELVGAEEEAEDSTESGWLDKIQLGLDGLGLVNLIPGGQIIGAPRLWLVCFKLG